jgi:pyruvate dehydrogenase E2 component (dihydrolipoamide acetyltransferase)
VTDLVLPNLGDGVAQGDVLKELVKPGDQQKVDQPVLELETDKATIEVPSTWPASSRRSASRPATR